LKYKVLLVDDDMNLRKFVTINLEARGYQVVQAADGVEAVSLIDDQNFDIIILDINMPRVDGFAVCKLVRQRFNTPIMMLSARQEPTDKARCFELGADGYMTKPFGLREFLARIEVLLRRASPPAPKKD
jgi:DNA-binding response OmpR family regulator